MGLFKILSFAFLLFLEIHARNDCPTAFCGNNPFEVRFPFRLFGQQQQNCGYPGFNLSCDSRGAKAVLSLPYWGDFWVRDIDYLRQEIKLYDPNGCLPKRLLNLNLSSSPFMAGYSKNYTILSCPPEVARNRFTPVDCLSTHDSLVLATSSTNLARALNMCSIIGMHPIPVPWPDNGGLTSDLNGHLQLMWNDPNCLDCEARGDICGFESSTSDQILCFSNPRRDKSRGLQIFKIIVLSVVIPAIFCSICISCFIFTLERRHTRNHENAVAPVEPAPDATALSGLDDSTIESYSKVILGESRRVPGPNGATCPICLEDYHPKDTIRCIPSCEHCFHSECIDEWLRIHGTCPVCRNSPSPTRGANA
ncbi:putative RING-H2 finger protein ATL21A [Primulina tabacum]|uniref:putative RING-H2 finger protein ATL21A n=1 Tax=Primulina tabacum TaxID=48773 RepID=UPI003F5AB0CA